jgi:NADPH-dependent 2,4-dienoyl-CoA reductase/sulfur reductase-like enzyme
VRPASANVVIVGAGAAGFSVAESLRSEGFVGPIQIVGDEPGAPYDRPPLSKQVLAGTWAPEKADLLPQRRIDALDAELILGTSARSLDPVQQVVLLADGRQLAYSDLVIATGVRARELPHPDLANVHVLRTLEHALALRAGLVDSGAGPGLRLVVIGGGFLGLEAAASARMMGADVTVVEPVPGPPLAARIGEIAAGKLLDLHLERGVRILTGVGVTALSPSSVTFPVTPSPYVEAGGEPGRSEPVRAVHLTSGEVLDADLVLVAIGSEPCVGWLEGSGIRVDDGVVCDEYSRAAPNVWAAGDVARWLHLGLARHVRLEHRTNATEQGRCVAQNILGAGVAFRPVPFFWTDHFDVKVQLAGVLPAGAEGTVADGAVDGASFVLEFRVGAELVGVLGWNAARKMAPYRKLLEPGLAGAGT